MLTGYPSHTTQRAQQRVRTTTLTKKDVVENASTHREKGAASAKEGNKPIQLRGGASSAVESQSVVGDPTVESAVAPAAMQEEEEVSFGAPPQPVTPRSEPNTADGPLPVEPRGPSLLPALQSPSASTPQRPLSKASMLYAYGGDHLPRPSSRSGGAMSANTVARVERSEQRKVLLEQQLALERAYWNTKSAFQGLRSQAEQHIYARELTALWTERTDKSPYWTNQVRGLEAAHHSTSEWRRNPIFVPSPRRRGQPLDAASTQGENATTTTTTTAALLTEAFPQSIAWAATDACQTCPSKHHQQGGSVTLPVLDHRVCAAPVVPRTSWRAAIPMYSASTQSLRIQRSPPSSPKKPLSPRNIESGSRQRGDEPHSLPLEGHSNPDATDAPDDTKQEGEDVEAANATSTPASANQRRQSVVPADASLGANEEQKEGQRLNAPTMDKDESGTASHEGASETCMNDIPGDISQPEDDSADRRDDEATDNEPQTPEEEKHVEEEEL